MSITSTLRSYCIVLIVFLTTYGYAQDLLPAYAPIYKDDVVARVDITISPDSLAIILAPGNEESEYYFHATFRFDNGTIRDTFEDVGFQLRGNTSRISKKKSFQVSLNTYAPGRTWYGVEKLNLNGEHNDPTVSRSKIAWDLLRDIGVPAPRSSHVELYINGTYYGLYANVEHIDEEFVQTRFGNNDGNLYKCTWPADMDYLGNDPNLYKVLSGDTRVYELKTNQDKDDYTDLSILIDVLNNTPTSQLPCALEKIFNVNSYLKAIAFDILAGNWDGPLFNKNNFYLYHNQSTGQFEYIPYDLDNTFGIDWFNINWAERDIYHWASDEQPRPLYWRIISVQEYKDRLSYYLHTIVSTYYKEDVLFPKLDALKTMLAPFVADDDYYALDYGFTIDDFNDGFVEALPYFHTPVGIKEFISKRRSATLQQLQLNPIDPIITMATANRVPGSNDIFIKAFIEDDHNIGSVESQLQWDGIGPVYVLYMYDDGAHDDNIAGDGWYGASIAAPDTVTELHYSILATDVNDEKSVSPVCGSYLLGISSSAVTLAINEFMASNTTIVTDEAGEYEDWIEIYNYGSEPVYLGEYYLSDNSSNPTKWSFPDQWLEPDQYLVIWADEDQVQGSLHSNFKLSAGGEFIGIFDSDANSNSLIDGLDFGPQVEDVPYGRYPNGTGPFMALHPTPGGANQQITAVDNAKGLSEIKIYPNPVGDVLTIEMPGNALSMKFEIVDAFGQVTSRGEMYERTTIQMTGYNAGLYFIRFQSMKSNAVFRLFKG